MANNHGGRRFGAGRPLIEKRKVQMTLTLDQGVLLALDEFCKESNTSRSSVIVDLIKKKLNMNKNAPKGES